MNFKIGKNEIGSIRTFVIAEIGNNHNGDFDRAKLMIVHVSCDEKVLAFWTKQNLCIDLFYKTK